MEINSAIPTLNQPENMIQQELKPLKGLNLEADVQRFEQVLFNEQQYLFRGPSPMENANLQNAISTIGKALFEKTGNYKKSIDFRMNKVRQLLGSKDLNEVDLINLQWHITLYSVETTMISTCGKKVNEGIETLFRNH
jgi:hypothetical protein